MNHILYSVKHFLLTNDYWDFKLGAIFVAISQLPFMGAVTEALASLTGIALLIKAGFGAYGLYLDNKLKKKKLEKDGEVK